MEKMQELADAKDIYEECKNNYTVHLIYAGHNSLTEDYARKLWKELQLFGLQVDIGQSEDPNADINHYLYADHLETYCREANNIVRTVLIIEDQLGYGERIIKNQKQKFMAGICLSIDEVNALIAKGVPRNRIFYAGSVAQDRIIRPKKIVLGITNRCYHHYDFRKRDDLILQVCRQLEPEFFKLKIMGSGWDDIINSLKNIGFEVEYYETFDREIYKQLMSSLDYWFYYGFDEGAMGYLDALQAGVETIATPQGFHLDAKRGLTYPCVTIRDFADVLINIQNGKKAIIDSVKEQEWRELAGKHIEIWGELLVHNIV